MIDNKLSQSFTSLASPIQASYGLSIVIPTRNEAGNIEPLLVRIQQAMKDIPTEVIFVDDSNDNTPEVIKNLQYRYSLQINLITRAPEQRKNGLGGAVVEGFKAAQAPWVCVMDADLQHPPESLPKILKEAENGRSDIVIGSRLAAGGDASSLGLKRNFISHTFAMITRVAFPKRLVKITDPLSGFFITRRAALNLDELQPDGFKILLEIMIKNPKLKISEIPIQFGYRYAGESKASVVETVRFFRGLYRLRMAGNQNFMRFLAVGVSGLAVNSLALAAFTEWGSINYLVSAVLATQASTLWNFGLTEAWVFGKRKTGRPFIQRMFGFILINNALLLLRTPIMTFMVSQWHVHYLIANLASLFAMTLLRYLIADKWLWNTAGRVSHPLQNRNLENINVE
ncbi:MAG: glycosyltransferase family 2 protein [Chloroflexota bacterium]